MIDPTWSKQIVESARAILWTSPAEGKDLTAERLLNAGSIRAPRSEAERLMVLGVVTDVRQKSFEQWGVSAPIEDLLRYTRRHSREVGLTRASVGRAFNRTDTWMARHFMRLAGSSFAQVLSNVRLEDGAELLRTTNASVKEIALTVGFKHSGSFPRLFKRRFGLAPAQWRSQKHKRAARDFRSR